MSYYEVTVARPSGVAFEPARYAVTVSDMATRQTVRHECLIAQVPASACASSQDAGWPPGLGGTGTFVISLDGNPHSVGVRVEQDGVLLAEKTITVVYKASRFGGGASCGQNCVEGTASVDVL